MERLSQESIYEVYSDSLSNQLLANWATCVPKVYRGSIIDRGDGGGGKRALKSLLQIWCKWLTFIVIIQVGCVILRVEGFQSFQDFLKALCFLSFSIEKLSSVAASIWFMPM